MSLGSRSGLPGSGGGPAGPVDITAIGGAAVTAQPKTDAQSNAMAVMEVGARAQYLNAAGSWDRGRSGFVTAQATFVGLQNTLPVGVFNAAAPVLADGQGIVLQVDASGALRVTGAFSSASVGATGAAAPASADYAGFLDAAGLLRGGRVYDVDTGAGTEFALGSNLRISAGGGSIEAKGQQLAASSIPTVLASEIASVADGVVLTGNRALAVGTYAPTKGINLGTDPDVSWKASAGNVFSAYCINKAAAKRYFQLFNKASAPVLNDVPVWEFAVAPEDGADQQTLIGTDFFTAQGDFFSTGIATGYSTTSGTYTAGAAADQVIGIEYK